MTNRPTANQPMSEQWAISPAAPRSAALVAVTHPFAVAALGVAVTGYLAVFDPNRPGHYPGCPLLFLTGYYCPGCGGLRALHYLIHGDLVAALSANLLVVLAVPVVILLWCRWTRNRLSGRAAGLPGGRWLTWAIPVVMVVFWGLRNLPELSWLAP